MSKRAVIYVRLSRYRGTEDPTTSPERQRQACQSYAEAKGWEVVKVVEDLDVSGSEKGERLDRPGLQDIRGLWGRVDVVLFLKLDRLARSVLDFHAFAQEARDNGADVVSVQEGLDLTTPGGRFVATILAAFAEMEAATIAERTRAGKRASQRLGRWNGGPVPYGYRAIPGPEGGTVLEVEPVEAQALQEAARQVLDGVPVTRVARWMTEHGPKPRRATKGWSYVVLRQVLTGDAVLGRLTAQGKALRDEEGAALTPFPAIFTLEEAMALRKALTPTPGIRRGGRPGNRLLSGLIRCHGCGANLQVNRMGNGTPTYRCITASQGQKCPRPVAVSAPALEAHVEGRFLRAFGRLPWREHRVITTLVGNLAEVEDAIHATLADLATSADPETFARLQALQAQRDLLASQPSERREEIVDTGRTTAEEWEAREVEGRRAMLEDATGAMVLGPGTPGRKGFDPDRLEWTWVS